MFTPEEIDVCNILFELPTLILESECRKRDPFTWGAKRRRSAIAQDPPVSPLSSLRAPSPPILPGTTHGNVSHVVLSSEKEEGTPPTLKNKAPSPATPLSFSPSESDDKSHSRRKLSVKRKRLIEKMEELTQWKDLLLGELENVMRYFQQLKAFNLSLKAKQQELTPTMDPSLSAEIQSDGRQQQQQEEVHPQLMFFMSSQDTAQIAERQSGPCSCQLATSPGAGNKSIGISVNQSNAGQCLPNLKVCPEESLATNSSQSFCLNMANKNLSRASAAQARQKRIQICRAKRVKKL